MLSALVQVPLFAAAGANADIPTFVVVLTGVSLVFAILLILIAIIMIQGRIFSSLDKKRQAKEEAKARQTEKPVAAPAPAPAAAPAVQPAPVVETGVPPEVVAAITAAVTAASDGALTLRSVAVKKQPLKGRGAWGLAGVIQSTEPF